MEVALVGTENKRRQMWDSVYKSQKLGRTKEKKKKTFEEYLPRYILHCTSAVIPLRQSNITSITWGPVYMFFAVIVQLLIYVWLLATPPDYSLPGSSVHEIFQARIMERVATSSSWGSFWPRDWIHVSYVSCIAGRFLIAESPGKPLSTVEGTTLCWVSKIKMVWEDRACLNKLPPVRVTRQASC